MPTLSSRLLGSSDDPVREEHPLLHPRQHTNPSDVDPRFRPKKRRVRRLFSNSSSQQQKKVTPPPRPSIIASNTTPQPSKQQQQEQPQPQQREEVSASRSCTPLPSRWLLSRQQSQSQQQQSKSAAPLPENPHDTSKVPRPFPVPTRRKPRKNQNVVDPPASITQEEEDNDDTDTDELDKEAKEHQFVAAAVARNLSLPTAVTSSTTTMSSISPLSSSHQHRQHQQQSQMRDRETLIDQLVEEQLQEAIRGIEEQQQQQQQGKKDKSKSKKTRGRAGGGGAGGGDGGLLLDTLVLNHSSRKSEVETSTPSASPSASASIRSRSPLMNFLMPSASSGSPPSSPFRRFHRHMTNKTNDNNAPLSIPPLPPAAASVLPEQQQQQQHQFPNGKDAQSHAKLVKEVLSRPFGRQSLGSKLARQYCVTVNPAELEEDGIWKYRVWVQQPINSQQQHQSAHHHHHYPHPHRQSLTTALIYRSLSDFVWLEGNLRQEYHGAALVPKLDSYLLHPQTNTNTTSSYHNKYNNNNKKSASYLLSVPNPPPQPLQDFLGDLLNGIRGQGEFYIPPDKVLSSSTMDQFLYKSSLVGSSFSHNYNPASSSTPLTAAGSSTTTSSTLPSFSSTLRFARLDDNTTTRNQHQHDQQEPLTNQSLLFLQYLLVKPLELCGVRAGDGFPFSYTSRADDLSSCGGESSLVYTTHNAMMNASGGMCGGGGNEIGGGGGPNTPGSTRSSQNGNNEHHALPPPYNSSTHVLHCELLEAESALLSQYERTAGSLLDKLQQLVQVETVASQNWRRLATSLQILFGYEKDAESFKLSELAAAAAQAPTTTGGETATTATVSSAPVKSPWRKINRQVLEKSVQALASCHVRTGAYEILIRMLQAYQGDLESIPLAMASYRSACQMGMEDHAYHKNKNNSTTAQDLLWHETLLRHSLTAFCRSTPIRTSRMAWRYWSTCASQCAALASAANQVTGQILAVMGTNTYADAVKKLKKRHEVESAADEKRELDLISRIVNIHSKYSHIGGDHLYPSLIDDATHVEVDSDAFSEEHSKAMQRSAVLDLASTRVGRGWDAKLSLAIMAGVQVKNPSLDETLGRDLKLVRKYAIGLREHLNRCLECVKTLQTVLHPILIQRRDMLTDMAKLFSGKPHNGNSGTAKQKRSLFPSMTILARAGVDTTDPMGWSGALPNNNSSSNGTNNNRPHPLVDRVGELALAYLNARDSHTGSMLESVSQLLQKYFERVEVIEGFVFMECVGIQLERHFSQQRAAALSAFEKKTDLTAALNIANRKRLVKLKDELESKLRDLGDVSHTVVKETKEIHLESKSLKAELHELAARRLSRARETSTERVVQILSKWSKETENAAATELKALGEAMATLERAVGQESALFYPPKAE